jgi:uncharacterized protein with PIN domain
MKFIADSMLGRLARWLRLLGHDTVYIPHIDDGLLLRIAREQNRTILTRDTRLTKARGIGRHLLLEDNDPFKQLNQVIRAYNLIPALDEKGRISLPPLTRCSVCNEPLDEIAKEDARNHVPEYVYKTTESFKRCAKCGRHYWKGTHQRNFEKKLLEFLDLS